MQDARALSLLRVGSAEQRIAAAKALRPGVTAHREAIERALQRETNHYVRARLRMALDTVRSDAPDSVAVEAEQAQPESSRDSLDETSARFVHEVGRYIGFVREAAVRDLENFDDTATARELERLEEVVRGIEQMGKMAGAPRVSEFDVAGLVGDVLAECLRSSPADVKVRKAGVSPLLISTGKSQIDQMLRNGITNAIDAVADIPLPEIENALEAETQTEFEISDESGAQSLRDAGTVIVTWGATDSELWIVVLDEGRGLNSTRDPFIFGQSTKKGHVGAGLGIARSAAQALGGSVTLTNRTDSPSGCKFEFRCPLDRA